jgi:hypothetical protein
LLGALALLFGCGDSGSGLYIRPFSSGVGGLPLSKLELTEGQTHDLSLSLSDEVSDLAYVDVDNPYKDLVEVEPGVIKFRAGEQKKDISFKGKKETPGGGIPIVFKLRDTSSSQTLTIVVKPQYETDGGSPPPKYDQGGPTPDTGGPTPDAGAPTPDQ